MVLQSSHATLMLILAAQAAGQLELGQALALAIGSNVGSSVGTAVVGALGGNRSGQRLALAHVLFNVVSAGLALALLVPLAWMVVVLSGLLGFGGNALLQLALFHTLFNVTGVALFWPWQATLARWLQRWLPDRADPVLGPDATAAVAGDATRAHHLSGPALDSADAAAAAVALELRHLGALSMEVVCRVLDLPPEALAGDPPDDARMAAGPREHADADALYRQRVKGVYADLLAFMGRVEAPMDEAHQRYWTGAQMAAMQAVEAVKGAKHLQKNMLARLAGADSPQREAYVALRRQLFGQMRALAALDPEAVDEAALVARLESLDAQAARFEAEFRQHVLGMLRRGEIDGLKAGSLLNDLGYVDRIDRGLRGLAAAEEPASLRALRRIARRQEPGPVDG